MTSCANNARPAQAVPSLHITRNRRRAAIRIALTYIFISVIWIGLTDYLVGYYAERAGISHEQMTIMQVSKGIFFLLATGLMLYMMVCRSMKRAEKLENQIAETIQQTTEQYRTLFLQNPMPMVVYNQQNLRFLAANDAAVAHYGYTQEEWQSKTIADLHPEAEIPLVTAAIPAIAGPEPRCSLWRHQRKDGTSMIIEIHSRAITFDGHPARLALLHDVTLQRQHETRLANIQSTLEQRVTERTAEMESANAQLRQQVQAREKMENELKAAKDAAEQANIAKSIFLANTGHEIRTPLTSILGYADLLLEDISDDDRLAYARIIRQNASHLYGLIRDVMDLSRLEAGKLTVNPVPCSPVTILQEVDSLMRPRAQDSDVRLLVEPIGQMPDSVVTDPVRLRQILLNLLSNAIKFSPGGKVTLAARYHPQSTMHLAMLEFRVIDSGIGMTDEQLQKIFQPFYQVQGSDHPRAEGFGLGLAIAKQLCEMLGGDIMVESTPGHGSIFTVTICAETPLQAAPIQQPARQVEMHTPQLQGKVLVVEDNTNIRKLVCLYLETAGMQVDGVGTGMAGKNRALGALHSGEPYDIILMDMNLPDIDGGHVTKELRDTGYTLPIIAMTAHSHETDLRELLDLGCNDVVTKPIDRSKFLQLLRKHMTQKEAVNQDPAEKN